MCFYTAIELLPLSLAVTINYLSPIFTTIVCFIFLGERLAKLEILSIFSALFGVILLTKPDWIFPSIQVQNEPHKNLTDFEYKFGISISLCGAISGAFAYMFCRKLGSALHPSIHPFYLSIY